MLDKMWGATAQHLALAMTGYVLVVTLLRVGFTARWDWNVIGAVIATAPPASVLLPAATVPAIAGVSSALMMPLALAQQRDGRFWPEVLLLLPFVTLAAAVPWQVSLLLLPYPAFALTVRWLPTTRRHRPTAEQLVLTSEQPTPGGLADELELEADRRAEAARSRTLAANAVLVAAMTAAVLLYPVVWMPVEAVEGPDGRHTVGYVLDDASGWMTVMTDRPRSIVMLASDDVVDRVPCTMESRAPRETLLQLAGLDGMPASDYRSCLQFEESEEPDNSD